jgi:uncharacterized protein
VSSLQGFQYWQMSTVPRPDHGVDGTRWMAASVKGAVVAAHARLLDSGEPNAALMAAWVSLPGADAMRFLLAGRPNFPAVRPGLPVLGDAPVLFPPGATARSVAAAEAAGWLSGFPFWARCLGSVLLPVPAEASQPCPQQGEMAASFDDYVAHLTWPFAWVVIAEPLTEQILDDEAARLGAELTMLRKREGSEFHRTELERGQLRYRELSTARACGLWNLHILAGAQTAAEARAVAAVLSGSGNSAHVTWVLSGSKDTGTLDAVLGSAGTGPDQARSPFMAGPDTVAALMRPPARELPGIRLVSRYTFDVTPEAPAVPASAILGEVLDGAMARAGPLAVSHATLNRHGFICGATGSGKSQTARGLLESLSTGERPVPWLVVEPAKAEYARMSGRLGPDGRVLVIRPGDLASPPASLNPLEPEPGFPLQSHADLVRALFLAAFEANEPFPQVLSQALTECYANAGWDMVSGKMRPRHKPKDHAGETEQPFRHRYPTLGELQSEARKVVDNIGYGQEVAANVRGFVDVRIGSLRTGAPGRFFEGGHPLDIGELLRRNAVLELEPITNDQDKAFLMGAVLIRIVEHLRVSRPDEPATRLSHVLLIEEAHRLLKNVEEGPAAAAVELFAALLAEIRAYGEGVVIVEQIPSKIVPDVLKNTALKVMHRLPAKDDRDAVGATMNLQEQQSETVVSFPPGLAAVTIDGADHPLLVRMTSGADRESTAGCDHLPPLSSRRSVMCGHECLASACNLSQINDAAAIAGAAPVTAWVEAVTACLIIGVAPPLPREHVRDMWPKPGRAFDCGLATAADRAVDARRSELRRWVDPDDFEGRLAAILRSQLTMKPYELIDRRRWQAGYYRYVEEWLALTSAAEGLGPDDLSRAAAHPMTAQWRERGLVLEGTTLAEQLAEIERNPAFAADTKRVVFGDTRTSGLRDALILLTGTSQAVSAHRAFHYVCDGPQLGALVSLLPELLE